MVAFLLPATLRDEPTQRRVVPAREMCLSLPWEEEMSSISRAECQSAFCSRALTGRRDALNAGLLGPWMGRWEGANPSFCAGTEARAPPPLLCERIEARHFWGPL